METISQQQEIRDYWFDSGTCTFLIDEMKAGKTRPSGRLKRSGT